MRLQKSLSILFIGLFLITNSNFLKAQTNTGIEEILVTAQRAEENIQDVPVAVTAFTSDSLELQQIDTFGDL